MKLITAFAVTCLVFFLACQDEIPPPDKVQVDYVVTDASAFNVQDGAIDLTVSENEGPFSYFWSNGETTEDIGELYAGEYTLRLTFGTDGFHEVTIPVGQPEPEPLTLDFDITNVSRFGKSDGAVTVTVSGGVEPYMAIWNGVDTTLNYSDIKAGTYSVKVMDSSTPYSIIDSTTVVVTQPEFICGTDSIADVDGNLYPTVQIGEQCWMAQNLRTEHLPGDITSPIEGRYCAGTNCFTEKGAHYTWDAMMNGETGATTEDPYAVVRGICPDGWAIPTRAQFQELDVELSINGNYGDGVFSGTKMRGADSPSGFDALYAGNWGYGVYTNTNIAAFWTSTNYYFGNEDVAIDAYYFLVTADVPLLSSGHKPKEFGMSVRCIKQTEE